MSSTIISRMPLEAYWEIFWHTSNNLADDNPQEALKTNQAAVRNTQSINANESSKKGMSDQSLLWPVSRSQVGDGVFVQWLRKQTNMHQTRCQTLHIRDIPSWRWRRPPGNAPSWSRWNRSRIEDKRAGGRISRFSF